MELDRFGRTNAEDILEGYLNSPTDANTDPIKFWVSRLDKPGAKVTPRGALARMGLDFLTAPGTPAQVHTYYLALLIYLFIFQQRQLMLNGCFHMAALKFPSIIIACCLKLCAA